MLQQEKKQNPTDFFHRLKRLPGFRELLALREERQIHALCRRTGMLDLQDKLLDAIGATIAAGPFSGMRYLNSSSGSVLGAKILGCYEAELHGIISEVCDWRPDVLIDIGAAEGYYAVGFARLLGNSGTGANDSTVVAFEGNFIARQRLARLARANDVRTRLEIYGFASPPVLSSHLQSAKRPVVWCDIEGGEHDLLDPSRIAGLDKAMIVLETHEAITGHPADIIVERFATTHTHQRIKKQDRAVSDWFSPSLSGIFSTSEQTLLVNELRGVENDWMVLRPRKELKPSL